MLEVEPIYPDWPAPRGVRAACSTRIGGVSQGRFAGLNIGRSGGDAPAAVDENRQRLFAKLKLPRAPEWIHQVHGNRVVAVPADPAEPDADAAFTTHRGVVCAVQAADCMPVLFCDDAGTVVAAAHAGWRGLAGGVIEATVAAMPVPAESLMAWLGPAIGPTAFEVGEDVRSAFLATDADAASAFTSTGAPGKYYGDLFQLARRRLALLGVSRVYGGEICTYSDPSRFYSFRRDGVCGRMAALIWLD